METLTIRKIKDTGKYTEFWFEEEKDINENANLWCTKTQAMIKGVDDRYIHCCKTGDLYQLLRDNDFSFIGDITEHLIGFKTVWENGELVSIQEPDEKSKEDLAGSIKIYTGSKNQEPVVVYVNNEVEWCDDTWNCVVINADHHTACHTDTLVDFDLGYYKKLLAEWKLEKNKREHDKLLKEVNKYNN